MDTNVLPGFAILVSVVLELAKKLGWLPDDWGGKVAIIANGLLIATALVLGQLGYDVSGYDKVAATVATLLSQLMLLVGVSWLTHKGLKATGLSAR